MRLLLAVASAMAMHASVLVFFTLSHTFYICISSATLESHVHRVMHISEERERERRKNRKNPGTLEVFFLLPRCT